MDPFWGSSTPSSISELAQAIEREGQANLRAALVTAVEHLGGGEVHEEDLSINDSLLRGTLALISAAIRVRADEDTMTRDLGALGITGPPAADIVKVHVVYNVCVRVCECV